jgi:hypothetical protein
MKSFQTLYDKFTKLTGNTVTANETFGKDNLNGSQRKALAAFGGKWPFLEKVTNLTSVASQEQYELPVDCRRVMNFEMQQSSTVRHHPKIIEDPAFWDRLKRQGSIESDVTQFVYQKTPGTISLWPIPATSSLTMQVRFRRRVKDMVQADYTTGTVDIITNGDETVTGSGSSWTSGMAGNWLRVTQKAAANGGDGIWYEIDSITSTTVLELVKTYEGTSLTTGASAAYTIGEMPIIPPEHVDIILWRALAIYYDENDSPEKATRYWMRYDGGKEAGLSRTIGGALRDMFEDQYLGKSEDMFSDPDLEDERFNINNPPWAIDGDW